MRSFTNPWRATKLAVVVVLLAATAVPIVVFLTPGLPERLVMHWGPTGQPNDWASKTGYAAISSGAIVVVSALLLGKGLALHRTVRRDIASLTAGMAIWLAGLSSWAAVGQRNGGTPSIGVSLVIGVPLAVLAGLGIRWLSRDSQTELRHPEPMPDSVPLRTIEPGLKISWAGPLPVSRGAILFMVATGVIFIVWGIIAPEMQLYMIIVGLVVLLPAAMMAFSSLQIDERGVRLRSLGWTWLTLPLSQIDYADVAVVHSLGDYGGWGWRYSLDGRRGLILKDGPGLVIKDLASSDLVITLEDADTAAGLINGLLARERNAWKLNADD